MIEIMVKGKASAFAQNETWIAFTTPMADTKENRKIANELATMYNGLQVRLNGTVVFGPTE